MHGKSNFQINTQIHLLTIFNCPNFLPWKRNWSYQNLESSPYLPGVQILHIAFIVAPVAMGADKFFHLLVDWDKYIPSFVANLSPIRPHSLMLLVGVIEIIAGIGVALKPCIFAYVVAAWLALIIVNLLLIPGYFDIAFRDFGLLLGALALARLSVVFDSGKK